MLIFLRTFKISIEIWVSIKFIRSFRFFIQKKREKSVNFKLSKFNEFIIGLTFFNFALKGINAFAIFSMFTLENYLDIDDDLFSPE